MSDSVRVVVSMNDRYNLEGYAHEKGGRQQGNPRRGRLEEGSDKTNSVQPRHNCFFLEFDVI